MSGNPPGGLGIVGEVRDGSGDPWGSRKRVEGPSKWSGTGLGTLGEVRVGTWDPR